MSNVTFPITYTKLSPTNKNVNNLPFFVLSPNYFQRKQQFIYRTLLTPFVTSNKENILKKIISEKNSNSLRVLARYSAKSMKSSSDTHLNNVTSKKNLQNILTKTQELICNDECVKILIKNILEQRNKSCQIIQKFARRKLAIKRIKIYIIILKIITERRKNLIKLQKKIKQFLVMTNIKKILKLMNTNYLIFYYKNGCCNSDYTKFEETKVNLLVKENSGEKLYNMIYNKYLKCFILFLRKDSNYKRKYKINFIINNRIVVDTNFDTCLDPKGCYFNVLDIWKLKHEGFLSNVKKKVDDESLSVDNLGLKRTFTDNDINLILRKRHSDTLAYPKRRGSLNLVPNYYY